MISQDIDMKPKSKLIGTDGNVFSLLSRVTRTLRDNKMYDEIEQCKKRVFASQSYDEALRVMMEYVEVY